LGRRSARSDAGLFVIEGAGLLAEAARAGWTIVEQFVAPGGTPVAATGAVHRLAAGVIERVATTEHPQPVLGVAELRTTGGEVPTTASFVVVGEAINDPGNAGTMIRSAEAAGADLIVFADDSVDPFNPKVIRASAGAVFHIPMLTSVDVQAVKDAGLRLVATSSHRGTSIYDTDLRAPLALVMGNEAHGVKASLVDSWVTIPQYGRSESLNVAMATTVLCFEVARQRHTCTATEVSRKPAAP
jgi:RNA methyltransferase, TrmH family